MGLGDILFGESPSQEIKTKKTITPEQQRLFSDTFTPALQQILSAKTREAPKGSSNIGTTDVTAAPSAPALALLLQNGLPSAPTTSGEDVSLAGLEERARKISSGEAFSENIDNLTRLSSLFQQGTGDQALSEALSSDPAALIAQIAPVLQQFGSTPQMSEEMQAALSTLLSGEAQGIDEYFRKSVQAPLLEQFQEDILPAISRRFSGNFYGSERRRADQRAQEDVLDTLAQERSSLAYRTKTDALNRIASALGIGQQDLSRQEQARGTDISALLSAFSTAGGLSTAKGQLAQSALQGERATSLDAISQRTGLDTQQVQQLATIAQISGLPLDRAAQLAGIDLNRALANANISTQDFQNELQAAGFEVGQEQTQFGQELNLANLSLQEFAAGGTEEDRKLRELALLLQAIGLPMQENIVFNNPGTTGLLAAAAKGAGQAAGTYFWPIMKKPS